ncbi:MAG: mRNA surveillance protein Pelota [Candidatus Nitrosopolaris sp.]
MIVKEAKGFSGRAYVVIPRDADDLFTLRRTIENGDFVVGDTTRVIKHLKEYGRPERGERVKVRVSLKVENTALYDAVDRLRITGTITSTDNELVSRGSHHSMTVRIDDTIMIEKERKWHNAELSILTRSGNTEDFILIAIDTQEASVAKVSGTHIKLIPNIYSGQSGKRYQSSRKSNPKIESFFEDVARTIQSIVNNDGDNDPCRAIIFGPGEAKRKLHNFLGTEKYRFEKEKLTIVDGVDVAGEDGIYVFLRSSALKEAMSSSKLAAVSSILDEVLKLVHNGELKYAMGMEEVTYAASIKNIRCVVFSDAIFKTSDEDAVLKVLNSIEGYGGKIYAVDSSTDIGLRVSSLGGIVALLRYSMR